MLFTSVFNSYFSVWGKLRTAAIGANSFVSFLQLQPEFPHSRVAALTGGRKYRQQRKPASPKAASPGPPLHRRQSGNRTAARKMGAHGYKYEKRRITRPLIYARVDTAGCRFCGSRKKVPRNGSGAQAVESDVRHFCLSRR